jgi:hypothetical protein
MKKSLLLMILLFYGVVFSAESNAMSKVKKFLPTVTESATLANAVNVYIKISDWIRATNKVISGMRNSIQDVRNAKHAVEEIIQTAKEMKSFSIYDMDTWAMVVFNSKVIVGPLTDRTLRGMGNFEVHSVGGIKGYISDLSKISEFDIRDIKNEKRRLIVREFSPESDESYLDELLDELYDDENDYSEERVQKKKRENLQKQKSKLEFNKEQVQIDLSHSYYPEEIQMNKDSLAAIERRIKQIEKKLLIHQNMEDGIFSYASRADTIIHDAKELMSVNLVETEVIYSMIYELDEQAAALMENIDRLVKNKISSMPKAKTENYNSESITLTETDFNRAQKVNSGGDSKQIYGDHPDQAPYPKLDPTAKSNKDYSFGAMDKAEINTQDIIQLRCQINLVLLKQEKLLRDIEAMKANTFAYIMIIDGFNRNENLVIYDALKTYATYYKKTTKGEI